MSLFARAGTFLSALACTLFSGALSGCGSGNFGSPASSSVAAVATSGPQLAYLWVAADTSLRPVLGVPGSAVLGASVVAPGVYTGGAASASSSRAVLQHLDGSLDIVTLPSGTVLSSVAALKPGAQVRLSPAGQAAVAWDGAGTLLLIENLAGTFQTSTFHGVPALLDAAVSDTGVVAWAVASASGVAVSRADGILLTTAGGFGGLGFAATDTLVVADASTGSLLLVGHASATPVISSLAGGSLKAPFALASSMGRWVLAANGDGSVTRFDLLGTAAPVRIPCSGFTPTLVVPAAGTGNFVLTAAGVGPIWAVAAGSSTAAPQTYFIPALKLGKP